MRAEASLPEARRRIARSLTWTLAWRNLEQNRTRTVLSVLAVALGVAVIVATGVTSTGVESGVEESVRETVAFVTDMVGVGLSVAGVMILVAAGFLIFNAFGMAVTQRRRQIGALRSLGVTRRQVMRLVLAEAFVVGGLGTLLGIAAGPMLGRGILAGMRAAGYQVGVGKASLSGVALAAAMGLTITFLSVWLPARRAARISPLVALRPETAADIERVPATRGWAGLGIVVALWIYLAVAPPGRWTLDPWNYALPLLLSLPWLGALLLIAPSVIGGVGQVLRPPLARLWKASGSLIADNLRRGRGRVTITALTFAVSMMAIVGATGVLNFFGKVLIFHAQETRFQSGLQPGWSVSAGDFTQGVMNAGGMVAGLKPEVIAEVYRVTEGRATVGVEYPVVIPEISAVLVPNYFSSMLDLNLLAVPGNVKFLAGDLETALPIMEAGCGLLLAPGAAARNGVGVGDRLTIQSQRRPLNCTVAGIVVLGMIPISVISPAVKDYFDVGDPTSVIVFPNAGVDRAALEADLRAIDKEFGDDAWLLRWEENVNTIAESTDRILSLMSSLLILAILAAALGLINTTVMSVAERRHELGLFRAVGATRRQVTAIVTGEAALIGLIGSALGLIAGAGIGAIFALAHGGNAWGYPEIGLWDAAWRSVRPALGNGLVGLVAAPLLSAAAALFPVRAILRGSAVETLTPPRQKAVSPRRAIFDLLRRGSVRSRFVLGTAVLLLLVLAGLIAAVTTHERGYLEGLARDTLTAMVGGQAGMIELNLPDDAQTLRLDDLPTGQFDVETMLRFRALMDEATAHGIEQFAVADRDGVILLSLDPRQTGDVLPPVPDRSVVTSERKAGQWRMQATAPIRNADGEAIGSMRMAADLAEMQRLLNRTRAALWAVGGFVTALGLLRSWVLATPLVQATGQLAAHAARIAHGDYAPLARRRRRGLPALVERTSLRTRLTVALVLAVVLLVGVLELTAVPIERRHTESQLKDGMVVATEWMGQAVSEGLVTGLLPEGPLSLERMLGMAATMDWDRLQELSERTRGQDLAYIALVDEEGVIQFSDQLALVGETAPLPATTQIEANNWRDEEIWAISTPLRRGREGEQVGALRIGVRRAGVEAFLRESRSLFRLAGLIAVLAGVLLAQAVGGAATAPLRQLAAGVRRVGQGDLAAQFRVDTQDELALLARAFNQMVAGLREREWLRDMFGRFVSHEVAEAIRTGQVRLEGENRVVSVLFCDIRDFTARSEQSTPEEMVALLNEYLPVVVEAAQAHGGTVNKFGGDSSLIIYGAPRPLQESAYRAVLTALEMRANLEGLNQRLAARGETPIRI
ncbi:MAG: HAMP domain-containing protein, partial [Anaerolineae bacterium]